MAKLKKKGSELIFISRIKRDGSGTVPIDTGLSNTEQTSIFKLKCLSLTHKTFIASEFNVYVVKLKDDESVLTDLASRNELNKIK